MHTLPAGGTEGGTFTLTNQVGVQTAAVSGTYNGSYTVTGTTQQVPLTNVTFAQTANAFTATGTAGLNDRPGGRVHIWHDPTPAGVVSPA